MQFGNPNHKDGMKCFECKRLAMGKRLKGTEKSVIEKTRACICLMYRPILL